MPTLVHTGQPCIDMPDLDQLKSLIESSFTHDWILRVEYTDEATPNSHSWQQWGEAAFAIREAAPVMERIAACRDEYPMHNIRLNAEKLKPRSRMLYCVYRAPQTMPETMTQPEVATAMPANRLRTSLGNTIQAMRNRVWRMATVGGMLLASLLLIEEAMAC